MPRAPCKYQWTEAAAYHVLNHNRETDCGDEEKVASFQSMPVRYR